MSRFGYFWNSELSQRETGVICPEKPIRNKVLEPSQVLPDSGLGDCSRTFTLRNEDILYPVHDTDYIRKVRESQKLGIRYLDSGETIAGRDVFPQSLLSASAGPEALDRIMTGELQTAFCAVRPPGHHANRYRALGFCVFNNIAIAAEYARTQYQIKKILIVDWDIHPGNGTQEIFWNDDGVFYLSFHQSDLFEEAGKVSLKGDGKGLGFNRNVPIAPHTEAKDYLRFFREALNEVTTRFKPELLLISAGFDAHMNDPASSLLLTHQDFGIMTHIVLETCFNFTGGKTLSILEGGYNPAFLKLCVQEHIKTLNAYANR